MSPHFAIAPHEKRQRVNMYLQDVITSSSVARSPSLKPSTKRRYSPTATVSWSDRRILWEQIKFLSTWTTLPTTVLTWDLSTVWLQCSKRCERIERPDNFVTFQHRNALKYPAFSLSLGRRLHKPCNGYYNQLPHWRSGNLSRWHHVPERLIYRRWHLL